MIPRSKEDHKKYYEYDTIKDFIGNGEFVRVYKAKLKENKNEIRAIKVIELFSIKSKIQYTDESIDSYIDGFKQEIKYMKTLEGNNNKNSVKFYEYFENEDIFVIVMEYCNIDLDKWMKLKQKNNEIIGIEEIYKILIQLNNSFRIMVANGIVHRDIKLENILIKYENEKDEANYIFKLSDYGISKQLINLKKKTTKNKAGTPNFMAPEITEIGKFDIESDLWSIGVLIYVLFFKKEPYKGNNSGAVLTIINTIGNSNLQETGDNNLDDLIKRLLIKNPNNRITWEQYFNHPFFKKRIQNQIIIKIKVPTKDISKNIYFLENDYYLENNKIKEFKESNKEINQLNEEKVEVYINETKITTITIITKNKTKKLKKFFTPEKEGDYKIKIIFKQKMTDCRYMFRNCDNIESVDLSNFDSSEVENMHYMFGNCYFIKEVDLNNLVTNKVSDMSYMFNKCASLKKIIFPSSFNTKKVEKMNFMFLECLALSDIQFSPIFQTDNVATMRGMFKKCFNLKNIDLEYFTAEKLLDMGYMFDQCTSLEKISFNNKFNTFLVSNMIYLFNECNHLKEINLSFFNTEKVDFLNFMFCGCNQLENIDLSPFKVKETIQMTNMFKNCENLKSIDISSFKLVNNNSKINNMFDNSNKIDKIKVNKDIIDLFKESFQNIRDKFYL